MIATPPATVVEIGAPRILGGAVLAVLTILLVGLGVYPTLLIATIRTSAVAVATARRPPPRLPTAVLALAGLAQLDDLDVTLVYRDFTWRRA